MVPVMFAMVPLVAIAEVMRAYLNARYPFVAPALMTVVLNGLAAAMILVIPIFGYKDIFLVGDRLRQRRRSAAGLHVHDGHPQRVANPARARPR